MTFIILINGGFFFICYRKTILWPLECFQSFWIKDCEILPRESLTRPSPWKYRSIRVITSLWEPSWLAIVSWVIFSSFVPSIEVSSKRNEATRLFKLFHMICSISNMTSEKRVAILFWRKTCICKCQKETSVFKTLAGINEWNGMCSKKYGNHDNYI